MLTLLHIKTFGRYEVVQSAYAKIRTPTIDGNRKVISSNVSDKNMYFVEMRAFLIFEHNFVFES